MFDIYEEVRILLLRKRLSMRKLAEKMLAAGYKIPVSSGLSTAFSRERIRFKTVQEILDYLGYELVIREKQK